MFFLWLFLKKMEETNYRSSWPVDDIKKQYRELKNDIINNGLSDFLPIASLLAEGEIGEVLILQKKVMAMKDILARNGIIERNFNFKNQDWNKMLKEIGRENVNKKEMLK